jgi:hypothetical protein
MRKAGFSGARATQLAGDHGIDVVARNACAQVKVLSKPVGRPDLQRFVGASIEQYEHKLFFSSNGFTAGAVEYATRLAVALFTMAPDGTVTAVNDAARLVCQASETNAAQLRREEAKRKREETKRKREAAEASKTPAQKKSDEATGSYGCAALLIPIFAFTVWFLLSTSMNPVNWVPGSRGGSIAILATLIIVIGLSAWGTIALFRKGAEQTRQAKEMKIAERNQEAQP